MYHLSKEANTVKRKKGEKSKTKKEKRENRKKVTKKKKVKKRTMYSDVQRRGTSPLHGLQQDLYR